MPPTRLCNSKIYKAIFVPHSSVTELAPYRNLWTVWSKTPDFLTRPGQRIDNRERQKHIHRCFGARSLDFLGLLVELVSHRFLIVGWDHPRTRRDRWGWGYIQQLRRERSVFKFGGSVGSSLPLLDIGCQHSTL